MFLVHRIGTAEREWQLSGGAAHVGRRSDATDARGLILPSYWKLKAGVEAPLTPTLRAQLEADNLLDTRSAQSSYNSDRIDPGAPRTVRATLSARF